jgi:cyclopropane fatty-acyl-phospholipid synthase-like methyltransferase
MMFFDSEKNVHEYIEMSKGYDGRELIEILKKYLSPEKSILELGMGPGIDLDILSETYTVAGSDNSEVFLDLYKKKNPGADLLLLDAVTLKTERKFDCIYSNKVLHHLTREELVESFIQQSKVLLSGGVLFHSFWLGDKEEELEGLRFVYYTLETIKECIPDELDIIAMTIYTEMDTDDSFYMVLRPS